MRLAREKGIEFGKIQIVDATHTIADVDVKKDDERQRGRAGKPRDPDAAWGSKGKKKVKTADGASGAGEQELLWLQEPYEPECPQRDSDQP